MTRVTEAHMEARRQGILDAAQKVFARKGIQTATMAEIASEAGLSAGAIYRYYASKEILAWECMKHGAESAASGWHKLVEEGAADPLAVFYTIAQQSFDEMKLAGADDVTRLMVENVLDAARSNDPAVLEAARGEREAIVKGLAEAIGLAIRAGQLPDQLDAYQLAQALLSFYMGARLAKLLDPANDTDGQLSQVRKVLSLASEAARAT
jgi:AcrR family transcriptional regulator